MQYVRAKVEDDSPHHKKIKKAQLRTEPYDQVNRDILSHLHNGFGEETSTVECRPDFQNKPLTHHQAISKFDSHEDRLF